MAADEPHGDGRDGRDADWDDARAEFLESTIPFDPRPAFEIPTVPMVRVCARVEPDPERTDASLSTFDRRYRTLAEPLPLLGAAAMRCGPDGATRLISALRSAAPWMADAIGTVEEQVELALWAGNPWLRLRPLLLVGGPGTGKSYFAGSLAKASGCALVQVPLGGDTDNRSLAGTARGWTGAQPALPIVHMAQGGSANPVMVLDELDKVSPDRRHGNAWDTLLSMLEPVTAGAWYDRCLMAAVDLRHVVWVATVNSVHALPPPLLSRFDVVRVNGPGLVHVPGLLDRFRADWADRNRVTPAMVPTLTPAAEALLIGHYARTRSLRQLRRGLELAIREAIRVLPRTLQ